MRAPAALRLGVLAMAAALLLGPAPARAEWATRAGGTGLEAGTLVDGTFAGLLVACRGGGRLDVRLTHNGARFDRDREHTLVLSVDGVATLLSAKAEDGVAGDDFVHADTVAGLGPLLDALSRGTTLEVSAPSGRYDLPLAGSSAALRAFRAACPAA